jgi:hypothetical protein
MSMEQIWRAQERAELRARWPQLVGGALAATLLGAGAFGIALWATNPPTFAPRGAYSSPSPDAVLVEAARSPALPSG